MLVFLLLMLFVLGACVGSFLNVCIYRLPLEKSIVWPGSHCGQCFQPIRWYDNLPLTSYWLLRGRCRACGAAFSVRYFLIELLTGLVFAGLFYLEVIENVLHLPALANERVNVIENGLMPSVTAWTVFGYHAALVCFLIVAGFCDVDHREIPLPITVTGTVVGLAGAMFLAWPWPAPAVNGPPPVGVGGLMGLNLAIPRGVYPWPVWFPLPEWLPPGSWQTGLATGLAGLLVGTLMLRAIRFLFGLGLGVEALGLGDADLMMMAGSFLGWQPTVVAFFLSVFPALAFGLVLMIVWKDNSLPFGPSLAVGIVITLLGWHWIAPRVQALFFDGPLVLIMTAMSCVFMVAASYLLRLLRLLRQ
jgi:leader peptidase (prepilin peptidase)/N-methyltransferase